MIYSTGWPIRYQSSALTCKYKIERSSTNHGVYVAFLDINLNQNGPSNDFVQMYGKNLILVYTMLTGVHCLISAYHSFILQNIHYIHLYKYVQPCIRMIYHGALGIHQFNFFGTSSEMA